MIGVQPDSGKKLCNSWRTEFLRHERSSLFQYGHNSNRASHSNGICPVQQTLQAAQVGTSPDSNATHVRVYVCIYAVCAYVCLCIYTYYTNPTSKQHNKRHLWRHIKEESYVPNQAAHPNCL